MKVLVRNVVAAHSGRILALGFALWTLPVHAQPLKVIDETYTATAQNTQKSHYRMNVIMGTPTNWRTPVDYGNGTVSVRYEVLEKPSDAATIFNICFEGSTKICSPYPPAYTAPGVYTFSWPFSEFWQFNMIDWTQGIKDVAVVLKTEAEVEAQGDPLFYPAKIHITVNVTPAGQTVPPAGDDDAGATPKDAGAMQPKPDAGRPDAGAQPDAGSKPADAGVVGDAAAQPDAAVKPPLAAGSAASAAGSLAPAATNGTDAGSEQHVSNYLKSNSGCATTQPRSQLTGPGWLVLGVAFLVATRRRRGMRAG